MGPYGKYWRQEFTVNNRLCVRWRTYLSMSGYLPLVNPVRKATAESASQMKPTVITVIQRAAQSPEASSLPPSQPCTIQGKHQHGPAQTNWA